MGFKIRKIVLVNVVLILLLSALACAQSSGVISGKVLPVESNAMVYVNHQIHDGSIKTESSVKINATGEYSIIVPYGVYDVLIVGEGDYTNKSVRHLMLVEEIPIIEIEDLFLSKKGEIGSISGYVTPAIEGANVLIKEFGKEGFDDSMILLKDGRYEFTGLKPGTYGLFVRGADGYYNYNWGQIDINANTEIKNFNLTLSPRTNKYLIDRIIIEFIPGLSESEKNNILNFYGSKKMSHYSYSPNYVISLPADKTVDETLEMFNKDSKIKDAHREGIYFLASTTDFKNAEVFNKPSVDDTFEKKEKIKDSNNNELSTIPLDSKEEQKVKTEKETKSVFSKIIQFFKSLFGFK